MGVLKNIARTNPDMCSQCNTFYGSCCKITEESNKDMPAPVSEPEIQRILQTVTHRSRDHLFERQENSPLFINQMAALFPDMADSLDRIFPDDQTHYQLKTVNNGCVFLSVRGCILPDHARPLFCRIFPFWFFDDQPQIFQDQRCLALQSCKTVPELLLALGTNSEALRNIHLQIRQELGFGSAKIQMKRTAVI